MTHDTKKPKSNQETFEDYERVYGDLSKSGECENNYMMLGYEVIRKALKDIKLCNIARVIKNGKAIDNDKWPKKFFSGRKCILNGHYDRSSKVEELIHFFAGGELDNYLDMLDATGYKDAIMRKAGL